MENTYEITIIYDPEADVWTAQSQDIPGLVLESEEQDMLLEKIREAAPELLKLNRPDLQEPVQLHVVSETGEVLMVFGCTPMHRL